MILLADTVKRIVELGGNIDICEEGYLPVTLEEIVEIAKKSGAHITIESSNYLAETLKRLVSIGGNSVTIRIKKNN